MREFAESIIRLSWAVSLLGIQQTGLNLFVQGGGSQASNEPDACEPVTQAAIDQLDSYTTNLFNQGDSLQKSLLDLVFGLADPANWNPGRFFPGKKCVNYAEVWGPMPPLD